MTTEQLSEKEKLITVLKKYRGTVSLACEECNVLRSQYDGWMKEDIEFKTAVKTIAEDTLDLVEWKLIQKIEGIVAVKETRNGEREAYEIPPDMAAIKMYLLAKGKRRGYGESTSGPLSDDEPDEIQKIVFEVIENGERKQF